LSVECVLCCQVEVSATSWSLVQSIPTDCGASCVITKSRELGGHSPRWAAEPERKKNGRNVILAQSSYLYRRCLILAHFQESELHGCR
jgi:hypothetical protein